MYAEYPNSNPVFPGNPENVNYLYFLNLLIDVQKKNETNIVRCILVNATAIYTISARVLIPSPVLTAHTIFRQGRIRNRIESLSRKNVLQDILVGFISALVVNYVYPLGEGPSFDILSGQPDMVTLLQ